MKVELPESVIRPETRRPANRVAWLVVAAIVAVFAGWQVFGLPGNLIRRNIAPPDLSGKAWGLRELWIEDNGTWSIKREGYADRRGLYKLTPEDQLWREDEAPLLYEPYDWSGIAHGSPKIMQGGYLLDVKASPRYWELVRGMRRAEDEPKLPRPEAATAEPDGEEAPAESVNGDAPVETAEEEPTTATTPSGYNLPLPSFGDDLAAAVAAMDPAEPPAGDAPAHEDKSYVPLEIYHMQHEGHSEHILPGSEYYPSMDSWAYVYPNLWLTTNNQQWLHRVPVTVEEDEVVIGEAVSVELDTTGRLPMDCVVGWDRGRDALFILRADGFRRWYDPVTLARTGSDELPGVWQQEYATLNAGPVQFVYDSGYPLTRDGYRRLMRVLMVIFLGSLLAIAILGSVIWRSTSAATTAATGSSDSSATT